MFGVTVEPIHVVVAAQFPVVARKGLFITAIATELPAAKAGVGNAVPDTDGLGSYLDAVVVKETVKATVVRGGKEIKVTLAVPDREPSPAKAKRHD